MITKAEFRDLLKRMRFVDKDQLGNPDWWPYFRQNPFQYFSQCSEHNSDLIWKAITEPRLGSSNTWIPRDEFDQP